MKFYIFIQKYLFSINHFYNFGISQFKILKNLGNKVD